MSLDAAGSGGPGLLNQLGQSPAGQASAENLDEHGQIDSGDDVGINVESNADYIENWSVRGRIRWTKDGSLEISKDDGHRVRLSGYIRKFEVNDEEQVITVRYKN